MTRINCVPVTELHSKHLVAEYRELPRVFGLVAKAVERGERPDDPRNPTRYTLGPGHVRFFYPRLLYCSKRFDNLVREMVARGYLPTNKNIPAGTCLIPGIWWADWEPDPQALHDNRMRILARWPK